MQKLKLRNMVWIISIAIYIGLISQSICFASPHVTIDSLREIQRACAENSRDPQNGNIDYLLKTFLAYLQPGEKFVDLGSGDGRIVLLASMYGVDSTGIEIDPERYHTSLAARKSLHVLVDSKRIHFLNKDFLECDLSHYNVFFINQGWPDETNRILESKLDKEAMPGSLFILIDPGPFHINNTRLLEDFKAFDAGTEFQVQILKKIK